MLNHSGPFETEAKEKFQTNPKKITAAVKRLVMSGRNKT